jgi:capsular exopolysaccharide synthesis family protein
MSQVEGRTPAVDQHADSQGAALDMRAYIAPILRRWWLVVGIAILAAGGTYALTQREQKTYTTTARVYVTSANPTAAVTGGQIAGGPLYQQQLQNIANEFTGAENTVSAYRLLGVPIGYGGFVTVTPETTSSFEDVTASSSSPTFAVRLATAYVTAYIASQNAAVTAAAKHAATAAQTQLQATPNTAAEQLQRAQLVTEIAQYDTIARDPSAFSGLSLVDPAPLPTAPSSPRPARDAVLAGIVGLLLGIGLAFLLDLIDRRLVRVSAVQSLYGRPVVAVLPHVPDASSRANDPFLTPPEFIETMRSLRVNLRLAPGGRPLKSVLVTSALPSEGKSTVVRDLAFAYADAGERVLVIDCDLRRPSVARMFGVAPELGLAQVLRREASPAQAAVTIFRTNASASNGSTPHAMVTGDPRVHGSIDVITHGEHVESPVALLSSTTMAALLATASAQYDVVILDSSPILTVSDAVPLLGQVSAVLFVARLGVTTREAAERLTELGQRVPEMNLVGIVVNDMRGNYGDEGYATYSRYGYAYAHPEAKASEQSAAVYAPSLPSDSELADDRPPEVSSAPAEAVFPYDPRAPYAQAASHGSTAPQHDPSTPFDPGYK